MGHSLRSLPRATASPAFNSEVLRKVRATADAPRPATFVWRMAASVAMAACLLAVITVVSMQHMQQQNVARLRVEQQKLQAELQAVKNIAGDPEPVLVLENAKGTQVIMDLDSAQAVQPASYRTFD